MGVPEEHQKFLPQEPLSEWARSRESEGPQRRRGKVFAHLLGVSLLLATLFVWSRGFVRCAPVQTSMISSSAGGEMQWEPVCSQNLKEFSNTLEEITFGAGQTLSIVQKTEREWDNPPARSRYPRVFGHVDLTPAHDGSDEKGSIEMRISTNIEALDVSVDFDPERQEFVVVTPRWVEWDERWGACIHIGINVTVPVGASLDDLLVRAEQLNVNIENNFALKDLRSAAVTTISGNVATGAVSGGSGSEMVTPYALDARQVIVETVSGAVKGWFPLHDLVKVKTVAGDITVDLTPYPSPEQAVLDISSTSGNLVVKEKWSHVHDQGLPVRDYVTSISTTSGNIEANVAFTSDAKIDSLSGNLSLQLVPVPGAQETTSNLQTSSKSGRSEISLLEPPFHSDETPSLLSSLVSKHSSLSGNINLRYPPSWGGKFYMSTMTGRQDVRGQGVEFTRVRGFIRRIRGSSGEGGSEMTVDSMSGSEDLTIGRV